MNKNNTFLNKNEDIFYLTDDILVKNNKIFVRKEINKKEKFFKISKNNWHIYLSEYGWEKLEASWRSIIKFKFNYPLGFLDCGGGGDCLFSVIAEALNLNDIYNGNDGSSNSLESIRSIAAKEVREDNYSNIIEIYRALYDNDDFDGDWNPHNINSIEELRKIISTCGDKYWGDHICLDLLQKGLKINFILMKTDFGIENDDSRYFYPICQDLNKNAKHIILYYTDEIHFQLVGFFNGDVMKTVFSFDDIPSNLIEMYKRDMNKT